MPAGLLRIAHTLQNHIQPQPKDLRLPPSRPISSHSRQRNSTKFPFPAASNFEFESVGRSVNQSIDPSEGNLSFVVERWQVSLGNQQAGHPKALLAQAVVGTTMMLECPVCKALVEEEKLVPLYGRGKNSTDPRSKSIPGINIPNRPAGQRPETAPPPDANHFAQHGFGFMGGLGGFAPMATARFGNFTLSAAFGGLIPSLFNLQVHGFPDATMYGPAAGFPYGFSHPFHGGHMHGFPQHRNQGQQADYYLKMLFLMIGVFVILALIWN